MNKFIISGNLTRDPELKYSQTGKAFAKFSVAVTREFDREKADFFNVTVFGKQAENCANYLVKGQSVIVDGRVEIDKVDDKYYTNVIADRVEFGAKPSGQAGKDSDFGGDDFGSVPF